jgi:hypothetical protein
VDADDQATPGPAVGAAPDDAEAAKAKPAPGPVEPDAQDGAIEPRAEQRPKQRAFLAAYRRTGSITIAAEKAESSRSTHYFWIKADPRYAEEFEDADAEFADRMEAEATRRAMEGTRTPVLYQGKQVFIPDPAVPDGSGPLVPLWERAYSDTLLIFRLKGKLPERYRDNLRVDQTSKAAVDLTTAGEKLGPGYDLSKLSVEQLGDLAAILQQAAAAGGRPPGAG